MCVWAQTHKSQALLIIRLELRAFALLMLLKAACARFEQQLVQRASSFLLNSPHTTLMESSAKWRLANSTQTTNTRWPSEGLDALVSWRRLFPPTILGLFSCAPTTLVLEWFVCVCVCWFTLCLRVSSSVLSYSCTTTTTTTNCGFAKAAAVGSNALWRVILYARLN